jgi:hypothetical protein
MNGQEFSAGMARWARSIDLTVTDMLTIAAIFLAAAGAAYVLLQRRERALFRYRSDPIEGSASLIERLIPRHIGYGVLLALGIALATWGFGFALAPNQTTFLAAPEWQFQPLYMVVHMITLGSIVKAFTTNFRIGVRNLAVPAGTLDPWIAGTLGWRGAAVAGLVAAPFAASDFRYLLSNRYQKLGGGETPGAVDYLMWGIWSVEWALNAFIWVILVAFLYKNMEILRRFHFTDPIDVVVQDKKYRPFLRMSAQGSSVVLAFSIVTIAYIYYTGGELSDYLGLAITLVLLMVGFVVPWSMLRAKVGQTVTRERMQLQKLIAADPRLDLAAPKRQEATADLATIQQRLDAALTLLRLSHLDRLQLNLGRTEARALAVRLAAPLLTIGYQVWNNWAAVVTAFEQYARGVLARFGWPI